MRDEPRTPLRRAGVATAASTLAALAVLGAQARYTARRRDLPTVVGRDANGVETNGDPEAPRLRLAALGDSTLTGPGLDDDAEIWIRQVARHVADRLGVRVEVCSYAVVGARARDVLRDQLPRVLAARPDLVVTAVGTNDAVHCTPLGRFGREMGTLVDSLLAEVPGVVIGGVGDLGGIARVPFPLTVPLRAQGRRVNRVIRSVVDERHGRARYIDVSTVDAAFRRGGATLFTADRFHPNALGHALWAQAATPVVTSAARALIPR